VQLQDFQIVNKYLYRIVRVGLSGADFSLIIASFSTSLVPSIQAYLNSRISLDSRSNLWRSSSPSSVAISLGRFLSFAVMQAPLDDAPSAAFIVS